MIALTKLLPFLLALPAALGGTYLRPVPPFAPAAGQPGSSAIAWNDPRLSGWATSFSEYRPGTGVDDSWKQPGQALGPAGNSVYEVVVLGDGGSITLHFAVPMTDGEGPDFAVFENSFSETFLELAFVEVSSDGEHFVRFPSYSYTAAPVGAFGTVDPTLLQGLAGTYKLGYGTPFDLSILRQAYALAISKPVWTGPGGREFSQIYRDALVAAFPHLDTDRITHVRLVDIVGDGHTHDCEGFPIYDPHPTAITSGFDLDAVGALHLRPASGLSQRLTLAAIPHQRLRRGSLELQATAESGLPVVLQILEGPAMLNGPTLHFLGKGQVTVQASQPGNAVYAPAIPVTRTFVIADEVQHLYLAPIRHLPADGVLQLQAWASSGLAPGMEIISGPEDARLDPLTQRLTAGPTVGTGQLRLFQDGNSAYAPAPELIVPFAIVEPGSGETPQSFATYVQNHPGLDGNPGADHDGDGFADALEFAQGTDPFAATDRPSSHLVMVPPSGDSATTPDTWHLIIDVNPSAIVERGWQSSPDLREWGTWRPALLSLTPVTHQGRVRWQYTYAVEVGQAAVYLREWLRP